MDRMAEALWFGLERSNLFIGFFSQGMVGEDWLRRPPGVPNPAIWTLGHLAYQRALVLEMLTGKRTYDETWVELFEMGCEVREPEHYPDEVTCRAFLDARLQDLKAYLDTADAEDLDSPPCLPSKFFKTKAAVLVHLTHHEAHHTGNLALLRRLLGKDKVL
ncbi:MAG: DinB family protein [candidate division Zixibacteria bacterium]|nr:DinB family protein [candidate division Zixibacteria bacterium]